MAAIAALIVLLAVATGVRGIPKSTDIKTPRTIMMQPGMRTNSEDVPYYSPLIPGYNARGLDPYGINLVPAGQNAMVVHFSILPYKEARGHIESYDVKSINAYVYYGTKMTRQSRVKAVAETYKQLYCVEPGCIQAPIAVNYSSPLLFHAVIRNLKPRNKYYYRVGTTASLSPMYSFRSLPIAGPRYPLRILTFADLGTSYNSTTTIQHMVSNIPADSSAIAFYIGDYCYADTWYMNGTSTAVYPLKTPFGEEGLGSATWQPIWDLWQRLVQPLVSKVPMAGCVGNHEIEQQTAGSQEVFTAVQARFKYNYMGAESNGQYFYYSFETGPTHNIFISPYNDYREGSTYYNWLKNDLANVDRSLTPWVTVSIHHPFYSTDPYSYKEHEHMRTIFEPLFYKYGVDIFFYGHVHAYERSAPVHDYKVDLCGAVHITIGDGGNSEGTSFFKNQNTYNLVQDGNASALVFEDIACPNFTTPRPGYMNMCPQAKVDLYQYYERVFTYTSDGPGSGFSNQTGFCDSKQPQWSQYREPSFGHGVLDILNSTHALWTWFRNQDNKKVGTDKIYIVRDTKACPNKK